MIRDATGRVPDQAVDFGTDALYTARVANVQNH